MARPSDAEKRKARKKQAKANKRDVAVARQQQEEASANGKASDAVVVEYVSAPPPAELLAASDDDARPPLPSTSADDGDDDGSGFARVLATFASAEQVTGSAFQIEEDDEAEKEARRRERRRKRREGSSLSSSDSETSSPSTSDSDSGETRTKKEKKNPLTRKQRKEAARHAIASLKRVAPLPGAIEAWDATAREAPTLAQLKAARNAVPVPRHWPQKRAYLAGKRGLDKPPFKLPAFIEATGISGMRDASGSMEHEGTSAAAQRLKQRARARLAPKMGKVDIDYRILHAAFFRHQTKPPGLTGHGDLYYEGREYDLRQQMAAAAQAGSGEGGGIDDGDANDSISATFTPGKLSPQLQRALGMDPGASPPLPPPWLVAQQRYGPPPSYPRLKIPGLNAPLPKNASYGYHHGGWGKPPVDDSGKPLYGDAFGEKRRKKRAERQARRAKAAKALAEARGGGGDGSIPRPAAFSSEEAALILLEAGISDSDSDSEDGGDGCSDGGGGDPPSSRMSTSLVVEGSGAWAIPKSAKWGELEPEPESEEEEVEEDEEEGEEEGAKEGAEDAEALAEGISSVATTVLGGVTPLPGDLDLRKGGTEEEREEERGQQRPRQLYTVLEQRSAPSFAAAGTLVGSEHVYVVPSGSASAAPAEAAPAAAAAPSPLRPRPEHEKRLEALASKSGPGAGAPTTLDVAIDPEELEGLDEEQAAALYADKASAAAAAAAAAAAGEEGVPAVALRAARGGAAPKKAKKAKKGGVDDDFKF